MWAQEEARQGWWETLYEMQVRATNFAASAHPERGAVHLELEALAGGVELDDGGVVFEVLDVRQLAELAVELVKRPPFVVGVLEKDVVLVNGQDVIERRAAFARWACEGEGTCKKRRLSLENWC